MIHELSLIRLDLFDVGFELPYQLECYFIKYLRVLENLLRNMTIEAKLREYCIHIKQLKCKSHVIVHM